MLANGPDCREEQVTFGSPAWKEASPQERSEISAFVRDTIDALCASGVLPTPDAALPPLGTQVEVMMVGGKPGPASKYGTGTVESLIWDLHFGDWRVVVSFNSPPGRYYGNPIMRTYTFPSMVHIVGSSGRPYSSMTPSEIVDLYRTIQPNLGR